MFSLQWYPAVPDTTHAAKVRQLQVQTDCSVHNHSMPRVVSFLKIHYFTWQLSAATFCSLFHRIIVATICRLPTRAAAWQREMTNDGCQLKCGCNPYRIGALASVSQLCSYIIVLRFLYLKFFLSAFFLSSNIIAFFRLGRFHHSWPPIYVQICSTLSSSQH